MLQINCIKDVTTTLKNPQANAICKQFHQSVSNILCTMLHSYPPNNIDQINVITDICLATTAYASNVAIHCTLNISPGALVLQRDMILNIPLTTDLHHLYERHQTIIDECLQQAYLCCRTFDYQSGDEILILNNNPSLLQDCGIGPFTITPVYTNDTITFHCKPLVKEQNKICQVKPYCH